VRIGLFGGTFDPPHRAHVRIAALARDRLGLDLVEVVPGADPPHRPRPDADPFQRFAMLVLALRDEDRLLPSAREIARRGTSYTVDTLREIHADRRPSELFLVLGADSLEDLPNWREPDEIRRLARICVVPRPGHAPGAEGDAGKENVVLLDSPAMDVSARRLRERLRAGERELEELDPAVEAYIHKAGLYVAR
jgi:nicotinate-nucleotide adenylyltransferase